jgi:type II secretory pathway component PulF
MPRFHYQALSADGTVLTGTLDSASVGAATAQLQSLGVTVPVYLIDISAYQRSRRPDAVDEGQDRLP